jgi:hypothetical protein
MRRIAMTLAAAAAMLGADAARVPMALAQQSEVVFIRRAWEVRIVRFDDGSAACVAQVSQPGDSFSIWADAVNPVRLQFYSTAWSFGEGDTADLVVQIDRRAPWNLTNANLYLNSVLFNLPDNATGTRFLREVMRGNVLYLRNDRGQPVQSYTLAGSSASIQALIDCVSVLGRGPNPFN